MHEQNTCKKVNENSSVKTTSSREIPRRAIRVDLIRFFFALNLPSKLAPYIIVSTLFRQIIEGLDKP